MQCPKCHQEMKSGSLEFEAPWWFGNLAARGRCCFWAEGVGRRELFAMQDDPPAWHCPRCGTLVVEPQNEQ
jgi:Domain of unknown function (DUF6487)